MSLLLPGSGVLLGMIAKVLDLHPARDSNEPVDEKTYSRYFDGERLKDETRARIFSALADSFIAADLLAPPAGLAKSWKQFLLACLGSLATSWDELVGIVSSGSSAAPVSPRLAPRPFLRLATLDLAVRVAALAGDEPELVPAPGRALFAEGENKGNLLKFLQDRSKLTREKLTEKALGGGNDTMLDRWLAGTAEPSPESIAKLADVLGPALEVPAPRVARFLKRHYTLRRLADKLSDVVGREQVLALALAFERFRRRAGEVMHDRALSVETRLSIGLLGSRAEAAVQVFAQLWQEESNGLWATELHAVTGSWAARIQQVVRHLSVPEKPDEFRLREHGISPQDFAAFCSELLTNETLLAMLQTDSTIMTPAMLAEGEKKGFKWYRISGSDAMKAANRAIQGDEAIRAQDHRASLTHFRRAAKLQPLNSSYQYFLGCSLWKVGMEDRDREMIQAGVDALWIAHTLNPKWDRPLVEIAIIYFITGRDNEALAHLEQAAKDIEMTPWLALHLGAAFSGKKRFAEALTLFDYVIEKEPDNPRALDWGAHCAFRLKQHQKGQNLAKRARERGLSQTYDLWQKGEYKKDAPT